MRFWSNSVKLSGLMLIVALAMLSGHAGVQALPPAQETAEPQIVQVTTADGLTLEADYWALSADQTPTAGAPAVVFIHQYGSSRQAGLPLVEPLLQAGYHVLLVDWRIDTPGDIQTWLDWLHNQPVVRPDAISTLGSGVGGTGALIGCANDEQCVTAIAVSPRLYGYGLPPTSSALVESALSGGLSARSALLIASELDPYSQAKEMIPFTTGEIGLRLYAGSDHGQLLFTYSRNADRVRGLITDWLNEHTPVAA